MTGKVILITAILLLVVSWSWFLVSQNAGLIKESRATDYLVSAVKVLALLLAAGGLGMRLKPPSRHGLADLVVACALGLALLGIMALGLAAIGFLRPYVIWIGVAVLAGLSFRPIGRCLRLAGGLWQPAPPSWAGTAFACIIAVAAVTCLVNCLAPLTANDALVYHLNIPKIYASEAALVRLPHNVYANMPHYGEILYTLFYSVSGETGAKIFYFLMLLAAGAAVYSLARRFVGRLPALVGTSCFLVQPLLIDHRVICNVDIILAYVYIASVMLAFDVFGQSSKLRDAAGLGVLAGFMLGTKYTAVVPCLSLLLVVIFASPGRLRTRRMVTAVLIALAVFSPWLVKNQVYVDNPVYPVFERAFDGDNWDEVQSQQLVAWQRSMGMGRSVKAYLLLPLRVSTAGKPGLNYSRFDGTLSPALLCLVPFALFRRKRATAVLALMALAGFIFWAVTSQQLRFLIPTLALVSALAGIAVANLSEWVKRGKLRAVIAKTGGGPERESAPWPVLVVILLVHVSALMVPDQYGRPFLTNSFGDRLAAVTGTETGQSHLERNIQSYGMFRHVNRTLPEQEPVFLIWENRGYYLDRPYFADSFFEASSIMRLAAASSDAAALKRTILKMGFRYVVVNEFLGEVFSRGYDPKQVSLLSDFVAGHLTALHSSNRLTLYRINEDDSQLF